MGLQDLAALYRFSHEASETIQTPDDGLFLQTSNGFSFLLAVEGDAQPESCGGSNTKNKTANEKLEERETVGVLPAEMECVCVSEMNTFMTLL